MEEGVSGKRRSRHEGGEIVPAGQKRANREHEGRRDAVRLNL